jgi:hypothetical protein
LLLVFLIPYAVVMTGAFLYLLYLFRSAQAQDPLERLPDPAPQDGGPVRVQHDRPLSDRLKTFLGKALTVGDLEVRPLRVEQDPQGDLVLVLHLHNLSGDTAFNPLPERFSRFLREAHPPLYPYTFLQAGDRRIYGGDPEYRAADPGDHAEQARGGQLRPGQEMIARLVTNPRDRATVTRVLRQGGPLLWRVHVRRGFVEVHGEPVSATAVVGVRFAAEDVRRPQEAAAPGQKKALSSLADRL